MLKNPTPHQIAWYSSLRISGISLALAVVIFLVFRKMVGRELLLVIVGVMFLLANIGVAYYVNTYYLRKYILRKIKVIYKTIHNQKLNPEEKRVFNQVDLQTNIIEEVEKEVEEWAEEHEKELNKYKSWAEYRRKYIGDVSHELKTPIFNIQGYVHTLLDGAIEDSEVNHSFLRKAAKNVDRLQTIVDDLESISRLESGQLILDITSFDIKELVAEVFEDLDIRARKKNIRLAFKDGASHNYLVKADRDYIRRAMMNLIQNSIKYGKEGGLTKVGFYDMDNNVLIEVADNGLGIPKKHINHVFDRFYRVDKSRSREQGGSGLGLSIVKHIIEAHKQTINVRSSINLGSTFGFTLEKS